MKMKEFGHLEGAGGRNSLRSANANYTMTSCHRQMAMCQEIIDYFISVCDTKQHKEISKRSTEVPRTLSTLKDK